MTQPDDVLCLTLVLTSLLAAGSRPQLPWLVTTMPSRPPTPSWLPCVVLIELAAVSTLWAILHPLEFAALIG